MKPTESLAFKIGGKLCCLVCVNQTSADMALRMFLRANRPKTVGATDACERCGLAMRRDGVDEASSRFLALLGRPKPVSLLDQLWAMFPDLEDDES